MNACPNINAPEWKKLVAAVGTVEAFRDFTEAGTIRSVSQVLFKINSRTAEEQKVIGVISGVDRSFAKYNQEAAQEAGLTLAEQLRANIGVTHEVVDLATAEEILADANETYDGAPSFYMNGKVYLVQGAFNSEHVFHEFAHPVVDALATYNPELFEKLYTEAAGLYPQMEDELRQQYNLSEEYLKREIVVRAISNSRTAPEKKSFLQRVFFAIKQMLRKIFGKNINVSKLSEKTTLKEMASMIEGEKFDVHFIQSSTADIVQFFKEQEEYNEALAKTSADEVAKKVKDLEGIIKNVAAKFVKKNPTLKDAVKIPGGLDLIDQLLLDIAGIQRTKNESYYREQGVDPAEIIKKIFEGNLRVLYTAIENSDKILTNLESFTVDFTKDINQDDAGLILALDTIAATLAGWAEDYKEIALTRGVDSNNAFIGDLSKIENRAKAIIANIKESKMRLSVDMIYDSLGQKLIDAGTKLWNREMQRAVDNKDQRRIDRLNEVKDIHIISKEGIRKRLEGKLGDAPALNSMLEAYIRNPDPIVGGFAKWFERQMASVENETLDVLNQMVKTLLPAAQAAGLKFGNEEEFFKDYLFLDKIATGKARDINDSEASDIEVYEAWTLLNPYKDYKWILADIKEKKRIALQNENWAEYEKVKSEELRYKRFMHNPYTNDYVKAQLIFEEANQKYANDTELQGVGTKASMRREIALQKLRAIQTQFRQMDFIDETDPAFIELEEAFKEYNNLYRETNLDGSLKNKEERTIAQILKEHRKATRTLYEFKDIPGVFDLAFNRFLDSIESDMSLTADQKKEAKEKWILENTEIALTDELLEREQELIEEIEKIKALWPGIFSSKANDLRGLIKDISSGSLDNNNQIDATEIEDKAQDAVRKLELEILKEKGGELTAKGFTKAEARELYEMYNDKSKFDSVRYREIMANKITDPNLEASFIKLGQLYKELQSIKAKSYTSYYVDTWQEQLDRIKEEGESNPASRIFKAGASIFDFDILMDEGVFEVTTSDINVILKDEPLMNTLLQDKLFAKWFNRNHIGEKRTKEIIPGVKQEQMIYRPTSIWFNKTATADKLKRTTLTTGEIIYRVPKRTKYKSIEFKEKTEKIPGVTVSAVNEEEWLPNLDIKEIDGEKNPFLNERYFELMNSRNKNRINFLKVLTDWHLGTQQDLGAGAQLGYMIPRFNRDSYDTLTLALSKGLAAAGKEKLQDIYKLVRPQSAEDYQEYGANYDVSQVVHETSVNEELTRIPIEGVAKLESERVSMNVLRSLVLYTSSAVTHKMLVKTSPLAQILLKTLQDPNSAIDDANKYNKNILNSLGKVVNIKKPQTESRYKSNREKAVTALYDTHFLGKRWAESLLEQGAPQTMATARKVSQFMSSMASTSFFAFNLTSALKNRFAAIIQNYTEAAAGEYLSFRSLKKGKAIAARAIVQMSSSIYHRGTKPLNVQISELFNVGESLNKSAEGLYRTLGRDAASGSWSQSARKFLEMNASLETLYGMMHFQKVKLNSGEEIPLYEAFRIVDGSLAMRPDVVDEWQMEGQEFKDFKIRFQGVFDRLQGNYNKLRQPQANRYLLFNQALFMKKFFISMYQRRFAGAMNPLGVRMQADLGDYQGGYYVTSARYMGRHLRDFVRNGKGINGVDLSADPHEAAALKRLGMDLALQFVLAQMIRLLLSSLFDYDPEDEQRKSKSKLRRATGALPFLGVSDDRNFNLVNFMTIHSINQMMQVQLEASTFNLPGGGWIGMGGYSSLFLEGKSLLDDPFTAIQPSFGRIYTVFDQLQSAMTGESTGFYTRDVGPMWYQKKGSAKWLNEFFQIFGGGGLKDLDPARRLESTMQQRIMKGRA